MSDTPDRWKPTLEQEAFKNAFGRAIALAGSNRRMADLLGVSESLVSRWKHLHHNEHVPASLHSKIDQIAGYPCMLETAAGLSGYSIRRDDVSADAISVMEALGVFSEDSGRIVRVVIQAKADGEICIRDLNLIEAEGKTVVANVTRMLEAVRAKYEAGQGAVTRMTGAAR
ncbi:hypothetical protein SAMN02745911_1180 [Aureimonas altamirensis DSM 21988]|uniref:Uncharacterized protein n=2 Tax=Aureimonas altamirensis TaxID=370622 RepID=A0A0P0YX99_9HYPH|nr:hypothetical protein [Aureimonas altamirensis]BAT26035.1 hypothetical protein [Aureimonas altamirensis]SHI79241.1 hypothetical protein SAMN02745911_1180 [Aureimonas altamirensis DSM 21988]